MRKLKTTGVVTGAGALFSRRWDRELPENSGGDVRGGRSAISTLLLVVMLIIVPAGLAAAVTADEFDITIPIDTVVFAPEGSTTVLATESVPAEFAGQICSVAARSENQDSVHPNNDLLVESGGSMVIVENVESGNASVVTAAGDIELGSEVVVSLLMGPDAVFSAGIVVHVDCSTIAGITTTTEATTTTTTEATTTTTNGQVDSTSVTAPPEETTSTVEDEVLGTVITNTTVGDEVEDAEVLPFTGPNDGALLFLAGGLLVLGGILVVGLRREDG